MCSENRMNLNGKIVSKRYIACIVAVIAVFFNIFSYLKPNFTSSLIKSAVIKKDFSSIYLSTGIDNFLSQNAPKGNIFLKFENFDQAGEVGVTTRTLIYFRSVYALYPRKVFIGKETQVISHGKEISENQFVPDKIWLENSDVYNIITFIRNSNGEIRYNTEKVR